MLRGLSLAGGLLAGGLLAGGLAVGCADEAPAAAPPTVTLTPPTAPVALPEGSQAAAAAAATGIVAAEIASADIKVDNAEAVAAALEKEIDSDLATEATATP